MNIFLFDMDGVLVEPLGYHYALVETVRLVAKSLGYGDILLTAQDIADFESAGVSSEWDSSAIYAALLLINAWKIDPGLRLPDSFPAYRPFNQRLLPPDFPTLIRLLGNPALSQMRPLDRADHLFFSLNQGIQPLQKEILRSILINARASVNSLTHRTFQELVLGSATYTEIYHRPGYFNISSYLLQYDQPRLSPAWQRELAAWMEHPGNRAAIFTSRPSSPLPGAFSTPEAELGAELVGLEAVPIAGLGGLLWLAKKRNAGIQDFLKPSPVHALAALGLALGLPPADALQQAANLALKKKTGPIWNELHHSHVTIFEDTTGGLRSAQAAQAALEVVNITIHLKLCGITASPVKAQSLQSLGAATYPDINTAIQASLG
jgi:hypothetical protein